MANSTKPTFTFWLGAFALVSFCAATACTTDDSDPGEDEAGGSGGSAGSSSSKGGSSGTGGGSSTVLCTPAIVLTDTQSGIMDFDAYDGSEISAWYAPLGNDTATNVIVGPYGYGDMADKPEKFEMLAGHDSMYAVSVSDTLADMYGGGVGLWLSECLDARAFTGISFWAKGDLPKGVTKLSLSMKETTSTTISGPKQGTCVGTDMGDAATCVHPSYLVPVTADWTEFRIPWTMFTGGKAMGAAVTADGRDIWQIQFGIELNWVDDGTGTYVPTPAPYSLEVDDVNFY